MDVILNVFYKLLAPIMLFCFITSIVSLIINIKRKKKIIYVISSCINFALAFYVPMLYALYTYGSNFIEPVGNNNFAYLIKNVMEKDAYSSFLFISIILAIIISVINFIYLFKKK